MCPVKSRFGSVCALFALAFAAECSWMASRRPKAPPEPGEHIERLLRRLQEEGVRLHAVPASESGDPRMGVYFCVTPARWEDFAVLPHTPEALPRWKGGVFVGPYYPVYEEELLGGGTAVVGRCRLFGDPEMVTRIRRALGEG